MGKTVVSASMSLDGFVALPDNTPGPLFDWYDAGDVEIVNEGDLPSFHLTPESAGYWQGWRSELGCLVVGRVLFDVTDGWKGQHPLGVPFVVLTHDPPNDWEWAHLGNGHFVTRGIEDAIARAREIAGDRTVGLAAGTIAGSCEPTESGTLHHRARERTVGGLRRISRVRQKSREALLFNSDRQRGIGAALGREPGDDSAELVGCRAQGSS